MCTTNDYLINHVTAFQHRLLVLVFKKKMKNTLISKYIYLCLGLYEYGFVCINVYVCDLSLNIIYQLPIVCSGIEYVKRNYCHLFFLRVSKFSL